MSLPDPEKLYELASSESVWAVKERLRTMLPVHVIERIDKVSEHYLIDHYTLAMKIRFDNGCWSPPLLIDDRKFMVNMYGDLKDQVIDPDEFITWCLMYHDAGDNSAETR